MGKFFVLLLIAGLGVGGWYFGLGPGRALVFPPAYERATPYSVEISATGNGTGNGTVLVAGDVRGPEAGTAMIADLQSAFAGYRINPNLNNASGAPNDRWEQTATALAATAKPLNSWRLSIIESAATLTGEAPDGATASAVQSAFESAAKLAGASAAATLSVAIQPLALAPLNALIKTYQTCGPLRITGGDGVALKPGDRLVVSGIVARESDIDVFDLVLGDAAGGRGIDYNIGVLNEPICAVESMLPPPENNGMQIAYSYGSKSGEVGNKPFVTGENPVIDVLLPQGATGFLYAFYVDAEGQVYHLIPHLNRQDHTIPPIGEPVDGKTRVRLSYPAADVTQSQFGFRVVAPYGTNMVVAVLSETPLFDGLRPRAESVEALMAALSQKQDLLAKNSTLIVSRYLVTVE